MKEFEEKIINELAQVKTEVKTKTIKYIVAALGLVAGLAWNDAVKAGIEYFFPQNQNNLEAKLIYAVTITFIVAIASFYLSRIEKEEEKKELKKTKAEIKRKK